MAEEEVKMRMKVRKQGGGSAFLPWAWHCPCCVNQPGEGGFQSAAKAGEAAMVHAGKYHPKVSWDDIDYLEKVLGTNFMGDSIPEASMQDGPQWLHAKPKEGLTKCEGCGRMFDFKAVHGDIEMSPVWCMACLFSGDD